MHKPRIIQQCIIQQKNITTIIFTYVDYLTMLVRISNFPPIYQQLVSTLCFSDFFRKNTMEQALVFEEGNSTGIFSVYGVTEGSGAISCSV